MTNDLTPSPKIINHYLLMHNALVDTMEDNCHGSTWLMFFDNQVAKVYSIWNT